MYSILLALHSLTRWFVLASLLLAIYKAYRGWFINKTFTKTDNRIRHWSATILHIQFCIGLCLYFISPIVNYFLHHYKEAVHQREIRFFGMEHNLMMFLAILVVTIGSIKAKRKTTDKEKFKSMALWYSAGLFIILLNIPWSFSPLCSRPLFRAFW